MKDLPITPIDQRKQVILKAIITDYVRTAEPVGSHTLVERYQLGVKSATIRNEMAELSELGYLQQPHTSAGRIPSDLGYRFYVDRLMELAGLSSTEAANARNKLTTRSSEMDIILEQTCRILSDIARYASVATHPVVKDASISHVSVAYVGKNKLLAVVVLDNGRVIHELQELSPESRRPDAVTAINYLTRHLVGCTLESLSTMEIPEDAADMSELIGKILRFLRLEIESIEETDVHLEGASYIVQQPEFKDIHRLEAVLSVLEQRSALYKLFSAVYLGPEVTVIIGSENPLSEMRDCSFVGARYRVAGRIAGTIGVLGPTRMDYRRAVSAVEFMAKNLGNLLTALSLA